MCFGCKVSDVNLDSIVELTRIEWKRFGFFSVSFFGFFPGFFSLVFFPWFFLWFFSVFFFGFL